MNPLLTAIQRGDIDRVKTLLTAGAPVRRNAWRRFWLKHEPTPLQMAVRWRATPIVECLLDHGADPNDGTLTHLLPLPEACYRGDFATIELLASRGADLNPIGDEPSPLNVAATNGREDVVDWLLEHGADPSVIFASHVAVHRISCSILARVIDAGGKAPPEVEKAVRAGKW
ncbi:MAG: ankyrin repeat domain-containing protein [Kofleriaceae bacterium]